MAILTIKSVMTSSAIGRHHAHINAVLADITQRVIALTGSITAKMTIGTKSHIQMTLFASMFILARVFTVMIDITEFMIIWPTNMLIWNR